MNMGELSIVRCLFGSSSWVCVGSRGGSYIFGIVLRFLFIQIQQRLATQHTWNVTLAITFFYPTSTHGVWGLGFGVWGLGFGDRKSTRLNSSHSQISYAVFCLKKNK